MKHSKARDILIAVDCVSVHYDAPTTRQIQNFRHNGQRTNDHYHTTYRWLENLAAIGLLNRGKDGRNNVYQISQRGRKFLNAWKELPL